MSRFESPAPLRRVASAVRLAIALAVIAASLPPTVRAQQRDSARVATPAPQTPVGDTVSGPPISPRRAFFSSLLVPGLGQSQLDRPIAGLLFVTVEAVSLVMIQKSQRELAFAKRVADIGVQCPDEDPGQLCLDPGEPSPTDPESFPNATTPNRYSGGRLTARRQHVEDWVAILVANHLLAGAEAYVAAHLWDLPARVGVRPANGGVAVSASLAW